MVMCHNNRSTLHIVLASFDVRNISPFFSLATAISQFGHHVSLVSSPSNIKSITPITNPANLNLVPLHGDTRTDLKSEFKQFLLQSTPDFHWALFDNSTFWVPEITKRLNIHSAYVLSTTVVTSLFLFPDLCDPNFSKIDWIMERAARSPANRYTGEESMVLDHLLAHDAEDLQTYERIHRAFAACDLVALPSYPELDEVFPPKLGKFCHKEVVCFGHLVPTATNNYNLADHNEDDNNRFMNSIVVREWLDKRAPQSVVYVAFEPETCFVPQHIRAIIHALENSRFSFLWANGNPRGGETLTLPERFESNTINRGLVCKHWIPHGEILNHPSVGGFLTNGGWTLTAESLDAGVPLILAPFTVVEARNASMMQREEYGYEIKKSRRCGGAVLVSDVRNGVEHVMADKNIRERVSGLKGAFDGLRNLYLVKFLDHMGRMKMMKGVVKKKRNGTVGVGVGIAKEKMKNVVDINGENGAEA